MLQRLIATVALIVIPSLAHAADSYTLTISAGKSDRMATAVSFQLPDGEQGAWHLVTADNKPSGKLLTDDYPPDHKHHHGIWSPWTKTEFEGRHPDFWNMGQKLGRVEFVKLDDTFSSPV